MTEPVLTRDSIDPTLISRITVQDYAPKPVIDGVQIVELKNMIGEDGDMTELSRLDEQGRLVAFPQFQLKQINRSVLIPQAIKAFHLHFAQDDIWHVLATDRLTVGLWDVRKDSATKGVVQKLTLGGGKSHLVFIPRGVAHGVVNHTLTHATLLYFVNNHFNPHHPDEQRLPWNSLGDHFWDAPRE
jgi:dTDP-4-dehydrorhamnose 3,5-epimerase